MKWMLSVALSTLVLVIMSCENRNPDLRDKGEIMDIVIPKYLESIARTEHFLSINRNIEREDPIYKLIDSIESELTKGYLSKNLKQTIADQFDSIPRSAFQMNDSAYLKLQDFRINFVPHQKIKIQDLDFIDEFLTAKVWDNWYCDMTYYKIETLIQSDTLLLYANREYELPIRFSYSNMPETALRVISNSLQGSDPNSIIFRTKDHSVKTQTLAYTCEAINTFTEEKMTFKKSLHIVLKKRER